MTDIAVLAGNHTCFEKIMPDSIDIHEHDVWEFMFFIKISGVYFMEGKAYRLHENDVLIIPPRIQHRIIMDSPSEYERYNVLFDSSRLPKELKEMLPYFLLCVAMSVVATWILTTLTNLLLKKIKEKKKQKAETLTATV